jgi:hypothetical protein
MPNDTFLSQIEYANKVPICLRTSKTFLMAVATFEVENTYFDMAFTYNLSRQDWFWHTEEIISIIKSLY